MSLLGESSRYDYVCVSASARGKGNILRDGEAGDEITVCLVLKNLT